MWVWSWVITGTGCECTVMSDTRVPLLLCGALVIVALLRGCVCARGAWRMWGGWGRSERYSGGGGGVFGGGVGERAVRADGSESSL